MMNWSLISLVDLVAFLLIRFTAPKRGMGVVLLNKQMMCASFYFQVEVASCLLLPAIQLLVGISKPTWVSLPFFIGSCVGLVDWSLTSNFLGLFRWWRPLWLYGGFNISLLYVYQLPMSLPEILQRIAQFTGLYKISAKSEWPEICSGLSLTVFYFMLSCIKHDLEEMSFIMSTTEGSLTEQLLPSMHSFFIRESRSGVRHTNVLLRGSVFRTFSINFFTYGFPVSLFALSFWSFHFASICAFGLLAYVGYVIYAFPSLFWLHRLNGLLLGFILLWAVSTYIFNVAFAFLNWKLGKVVLRLDMKVYQDMEIWEMVGLWHYPVPGFFLLAQFCLGILVALGNLVSNSVFLYLSDEDGRSSNDNCTVEVKEETEVLIVATIAWGLRKCSRAVELVLIFLIAMKPGFVHAIYMRHAPCLPVGFSILKAGLNKSVLLSVYASSTVRDSPNDSSYEFKDTQEWSCHSLISINGNIGERKIALYLSAIGQKFLSMYRSFGTYIAFLTILIMVYQVRPNYVSFGYIFLLLFWITGRQLVEKTKQRLWFPLKAYAVVVFIFIYSLSIFPSFEMWLSGKIDLSNLGYDTEASLLDNVLESLAIMIVMQLYSYERRKNRYIRSDHPDPLQCGVLGFIKRLLIWHSQKILFLTLFYASLSPISAFGFLYLLGLVICSNLPKVSRIPSKSFLVYTGFLVLAEYLFQMWGKQAKMFPGQKHYDWSCFLGFWVFKPGFWGLEAGLRGKVLVIAACTLQYNVFYWLEKVPSTLQNAGRWEEPCPLFVSEEDNFISISNGEIKPSTDSSALSAKRMGVASNSWPSLNCDSSQSPHNVSSNTRVSRGSSSKKYSFEYIWGSSKESNKWNKKRIHALKNERFETQMTTLKIYLKFWMENMFNLFGLEINMIALLLASFVLLNAVSMVFIALLIACILLDRHIIRKLWPIFVFLFASVLILEYFALWKNVVSLNRNGLSETNVHCHDCWRSSNLFFNYCIKCWLGLIVDDPRMLISYFVVFLFACFKLRADHISGFSLSLTYRQVMSQRKNTFVWRDLSFETKSMWTFLDYLRLYCYCHLLDLVLALILITGTLEYDILHLGYLGFALVFFRMRLQILKKKNKIFKFLRIYNFVVIVLSLAFQSPFVGDFNVGKCDTIDYIYEVIGFYKYDYGFRITSRSAFVEIIIFMLVSLQSYMFSSHEFDYVFRYLEAEQIGAIVHEQEKKAAWKKAQLQHIRESEEKKHQRNLQVEKMKSEMLNLQIQLHSMNSTATFGCISPSSEGLRRRRSTSLYSNKDAGNCERKEDFVKKQELNIDADLVFPLELHESPTSIKTESPSAVDSRNHLVQSPRCEIIEIEEDAADGAFIDLGKENKAKGHLKENPLISAVQLLGDGVSQVQSLGNQAVSNLVSFLSISHEDSDTMEHSSDETGTQDMRHTPPLDRSSSLQSDKSRTMSDASSLQIGMIFRHIWSQMRSNNDVVCYCCFVFVFLWNFSLQSMVYLAALFLYALCVNTGPSYIFWVTMLIYTEVYILLQYLYQIIIQHCGLEIQSNLLNELGFPTNKISSSFVINTLPLFLVYLFTLIQSSITAKDGEWISWDYDICKTRVIFQKKVLSSPSWSERARKLLQPITNVVKMIVRSFSTYWKSLTQGAESPPYFVQLSLDVHVWPEDGIQPQRIESGINQVLRIVHDERCKEENPNICLSASKVHVQSIERTENSNVALAIFEVADWYESLTPAADVAKEILHAQRVGIIEEVGFPYPILSVIGGGKRELDLYAYIFCADLAVFFLVAIFYQSLIENKSEIFEVYQLEDQFPKEFVFVLMVIFFLIVLDRIIYFCSFATGKERLEDINASLYLVKCDTILNRASHKQGEKQTKMTKFCNGICLFFILICIIWAPMLMYSSGNPTNIANPIKDASFQLDIKTSGGRLTLFRTTLCERISWDKLKTVANLDPHGYLDIYDKSDIQVICCQPNASILWLVPDVVINRFIQSINGSMDIIFTWVLSRDRPKGKELVKYENPVDPSNISNQSEVEEVLRGSTNNFSIANIYPRYFRVTGSGDVRLFEPEFCHGQCDENLVSADLVIHRGSPEWWAFHDINPLNVSECEGLEGPTAIIVSEETPQGIIGETLSQFSIWGLYITFVLAVGRFIRLQCSDLRMRIPYENLPSCDRLIAICEDIYAARAEGELGVEEVLYWTLIKIYRSPHMLLEYTKPD
ncbi:unnamed protein product [Camellia sinensis]